MTIYQPGDILLEKYRIEKHLGQGAFGDVYLAFHLKLNIPRAIKVLRQDAPGVGSTEYTNTNRRFELEARLGAMHKHANLIEVYEYEEIQSQGVLLLVMEYAPGGSLEDRLHAYKQKNQCMPVDEVVHTAQEIAAGLADLHARDIVHRDLKPSNILFGADGRARIADLGLAQVPGGQSGRSYLGSLAPEHPGTPEYKSPEQEKTRDYLKPSSDIYAFGIILFRMLTGRNYKSQRTGTRARALRSDIPAELDDLLARMLAENPAGRPWDGQETARLLEELFHKPKRIPRMLWLAAGVVMLVLLAMVLTSFPGIGGGLPTATATPTMRLVSATPENTQTHAVTTTATQTQTVTPTRKPPTATRTPVPPTVKPTKNASPTPEPNTALLEELKNFYAYDFSPDGSKVIYTDSKAVYLRDVTSGLKSTIAVHNDYILIASYSTSACPNFSKVNVFKYFNINGLDWNPSKHFVFYNLTPKSDHICVENNKKISGNASMESVCVIVDMDTQKKESISDCYVKEWTPDGKKARIRMSGKDYEFDLETKKLVEVK